MTHVEYIAMQARAATMQEEYFAVPVKAVMIIRDISEVQAKAVMIQEGFIGTALMAGR